MADLALAPDEPLHVLVPSRALAAAVEARTAGLTALVVEPRGTPVDKACGEGLMPGAVDALARLGVDPPGRPLAGSPSACPAVQ